MLLYLIHAVRPALRQTGQTAAPARPAPPARRCDRIVVLCVGKVNGILDGRKTTKEEVGLRMTNLVKEEQA